MFECDELPEGFKALLPEEDEPCFGPLIEKAKVRALELAGTPDGKLIEALIAAYEHADAMADMIYWNASDNGDIPHGA